MRYDAGEVITAMVTPFNEKRDIDYEDLMDFVEFLFEWTWEQVDHDIDAFLHFMLKEHGFNIMTTSFNIISRGITCGI